VLYPLSYEGRGRRRIPDYTLRVGSLCEFERCSGRPSAVSGGWPAPGQFSGCDGCECSGDTVVTRCAGMCRLPG
jgi:hypothetical protein